MARSILKNVENNIYFQNYSHFLLQKYLMSHPSSQKMTENRLIFDHNKQKPNDYFFSTLVASYHLLGVQQHQPQ